MKTADDLFDAIEATGDEQAALVIKHLESGVEPGQVALRLGSGVIGLVAALARIGLGSDGSQGLPLVQGGPTHPGLAKALDVAAWIHEFKADRSSRLALSAGLLQLFDFWDASHEAAQQADDLGEKATSTYWHLIAHRREPDPGNALYWARRVGRHSTSTTIIDRARPLLEAHGDPDLTARLTGDGWNHSAMITLCTQTKPGKPVETLARRLQRVEMIAVLEASMDSLFLPRK